MVLDWGCHTARPSRVLSETPTTRILGIDPGTATVGYGLLDWRGGDRIEYVAAGTIQTPRELNAACRLKIIRDDLAAIIKDYAPDLLAVEAIFFFKNAKTLVPVAQARGVILECAASLGVPFSEYTPMQIKLMLTGFGKADKKLVQHSLARLLNHREIIRPDDAADALAVAVCHTRMAQTALAGLP